MNKYKPTLETESLILRPPALNESSPLPGKTASVTTTVTESNTANAAGSGSLDVFATPMMIALMEQAACKCLADALTDGQTSVGTQVSVEHTAASVIGAEVTATATIEYVSGRKIEFAVTASDGAHEIGNGRHTRVIVDKERFMMKAKTKK
jgi:predicted thioesterase